MRVLGGVWEGCEQRVRVLDGCGCCVGVGAGWVRVLGGCWVGEGEGAVWGVGGV